MIDRRGVLQGLAATAVVVAAPMPLPQAEAVIEVTEVYWQNRIYWSAGKQWIDFTESQAWPSGLSGSLRNR